jgi:probable phosphoglycerate mutase
MGSLFRLRRVRILVHMTKILLVRHGHVEGIHPERFRGRTELDLTERGQREAEAVARRIANRWQPKLIYTSPLKRCIATAAAISVVCGIPRDILSELNDIDYGEWRFKTYEEVQTAFPRLFVTWFATPHLMRFPKGEALQDLVARSADALRLILERHLDETVVVVAHDSVNRALLIQLLDQPLSSYWRVAQDPCCINEIDVVGTRIRVGSINVTSHLDAVGS